MSVNQELVLIILREHGPMTMREIAERIPRAPETLNCIYKMRQDGMIRVVGTEGRQYVYEAVE